MSIGALLQHIRRLPVCSTSRFGDISINSAIFCITPLVECGIIIIYSNTYREFLCEKDFRPRQSVARFPCDCTVLRLVAYDVSLYARSVNLCARSADKATASNVAVYSVCLSCNIEVNTSCFYSARSRVVV